MTPDSDRIKGQAKEAAGAATDNDELRSEGKNDQRAGKAKEAMGDAKRRAESVVDAIKDRVNRK